MATANYLWDPLTDNVLEEYDDDGDSIADYTYEPAVFGNIISQHRDGESSYFHHDAIGSTIAVTGDDGSVTDARSYTSFGEVTESTGTTVFQYEFVGERGYHLGGEPGEYYVRRRFYWSDSGRWLAKDPIGDITDVDMYSYVQNSPVMNADPSGLMSISKLYEKFEREAERRRGNGPWGDSAQHCWAACYIGLTIGLGELAAFIADLEELIQRKGDWWRDIAAQHVGANCAAVGLPVAKIWPSKACDCCCLTSAD